MNWVIMQYLQDKNKARKNINIRWVEDTIVDTRKTPAIISTKGVTLKRR